MSTTSIPSRTRSNRKLTVSSGTTSGVSTRTRNGLSIDTKAAAVAPAPRLRSAALPNNSAGDASPTRIQRPTSARIQASSNTGSLGNASESTLRRNPTIKSRPQSMYGSTSGTSSIRPPSRDGSMRPPPRPSSRDGNIKPVPRPIGSRIAAGAVNPDSIKAVSRPPMVSDNQRIPTRSTQRTIPELASSGIGRQQSTRLTRTSSISTVSSNSPSAGPGSPRGHTRNANSITNITNLNHNILLRHPAHPSVSQKSAQSASPTSDTSSSHTVSRPARQAPDPRLNRPTFSTLQQHYSPAKSLAPKPTTAQLLALGSPSKLPSNVAITTETAKLQAELLQLHLLHREASGVEQQFRESARQKLEKRFEDLCKQYEQLARIEETQKDRCTALALKSWIDVDEKGGMAFEDRIQILDEVVASLWNLSDPGGKYSRVVRRFEKWMQGVMEVQDRREKGDLLEDGEVVFIDELESQWRDEIRSQSRKAENLKDKLDDLGEVKGNSSLSVVVNGCRALAKGMMMELDTMKKMEVEVARAEQDWIRVMIEMDNEEERENRQGAAWRRM